MGNAAKMQSGKQIKSVIFQLSKGYIGDKKATKRMRPRVAQMAALSACLYYTARRISDVLDLTWNDFVEKDSAKNDIRFKKELYIHEKKTGKYITIPLHEELKKYIAKYYRWLPSLPEPHTFVFKTINGKRMARTNAFTKIRKVYEAFGVEDVSPHGFRKAAARHVYEELGANHEALVTVQRILNHQNPTVTLRYIGIDVDKMNKAFNLL